MKKTFLLLFAVASLVATAQPDYRPMLCEGRVWNEHAGAGLYWTKTLYLNGDTVIEGETYKKLYEHATFIINGDTVVTDKLQVPVMEKDRRVYAYIHRKVTVYDFTLQPGDSLVLGAQEWVRINKIDTISVKGERYRRFHVTHVLKDFLGVEWPEYESGDADEDAFWVEGIGCDKGLTALFGWVGTAAPYARLSIFDNCMENGEKLFTLDDFKMLPLGESQDEGKYFPTGLKWQESTVEYDVINTECSHIYEIGADIVIGDITYKEVLVDGSAANLWIREEDKKVLLLSAEYPQEFKLYDFNWDGETGTLFTEYLQEKGDGVELKRQDLPRYYKTICRDGQYYQFHQEDAGIVIRNIGRVYELNRNSSLLGYKLPEEILPGLIYWKVLWIEKGGEVIFKSDLPEEWSLSWSETVVSIENKCATPTIAYDKGRLVFSCETPGAECVYEIKCSDNSSGRGSEVSLNKTYEIRVRATLDGYDDSDVAVATIGWRNGQPVMEGFSSVTMETTTNLPGEANADVNGDGIVDVADIATVISVMVGQ